MKHTPNKQKTQNSKKRGYIGIYIYVIIKIKGEIDIGGEVVMTVCVKMINPKRKHQ